MATLKDVRQAQKPTKVYTARKRKDTEEIHLFEGTMVALNKCTTGDVSACGGMGKSEGVATQFQCKGAKDARLECARIGRAVCGTCVSTLYTTYDA